MASRHERVSELEHRRLIELRGMLGTGQGIQRVPQKLSRLVARLATFTGTPEPLTYKAFGREGYSYNDLLIGPDVFTVPLEIRDVGVPATEYFNSTGVPMETDMRHWRALTLERNRLDRKLFPGFSFPAVHISPFGADRFRAFNPLPAFETVVGPLCFINR